MWKAHIIKPHPTGDNLITRIKIKHHIALSRNVRAPRLLAFHETIGLPDSSVKHSASCINCMMLNFVLVLDLTKLLDFNRVSARVVNCSLTSVSMFWSFRGHVWGTLILSQFGLLAQVVVRVWTQFPEFLSSIIRRSFKL